MQEEVNQEEGVEILDPELKKQQEEAQKAAEEKAAKMKEINGVITTFIKETSEKYGMKMQVTSYLENEDELGIWKGENVTQLEEMGFSKLIGNQF